MELLDYLRTEYKMSDTALATLTAHWERIEVAKGEVFLEADHPNPYVYLVSTGLIKVWFLREGKERILNFSFEHEVAIIPQEESRYSLYSATAIENSTLYRIRKDEMEALFSTQTELALWGYRMLKQIYDYLVSDSLNLFWMDKKDMYAELLHKHPDALQRIPLKDVASYLNITPSSLSRIRAGVK